MPVFFIIMALCLFISPLLASTTDTVLAGLLSTAPAKFIIIQISTQELYLVEQHKIIKTYPVSSGANGIGNAAGSGKTPLGTHRICDMRGAKATRGSIFRWGNNTGKIATIHHQAANEKNDYLTTRVLILEGMQAGLNKGKGIDSFIRGIMIHGTPDEWLIGQPVSHGCIRMLNNDIIELFEQVDKYLRVEIIK